VLAYQPVEQVDSRYRLTHLQALVEFFFNPVFPTDHALIGLRALTVCGSISCCRCIDRVYKVPALLLSDEPLHPCIGSLRTVEQLQARFELCIRFLTWPRGLRRSWLCSAPGGCTFCFKFSLQTAIFIRQPLLSLFAAR
jgi:hypothetical protein